MEQLRIKLKNKESRDKEEEEDISCTSSVVTKLPKTHLADLTRKGLAAYLSDECVEALVYVMQVIHVMHCIAFLYTHAGNRCLTQVLDQLKHFSEKFEDERGFCPLILGIIYKVSFPRSKG